MCVTCIVYLSLGGFRRLILSINAQALLVTSNSSDLTNFCSRIGRFSEMSSHKCACIRAQLSTYIWLSYSVPYVNFFASGRDKVTMESSFLVYHTRKRKSISETKARTRTLGISYETQRRSKPPPVLGGVGPSKEGELQTLAPIVPLKEPVSSVEGGVAARGDGVVEDHLNEAA